MNKFITRVEPHGAAWPDYEHLHRYMAEAVFHRTITGDGGRAYDLPSATYYSLGNLSVNDVRTLAMRAADRTGRESWVLVTQLETAAWSLRPAAPVYNHLALPLRTLA